MLCFGVLHTLPRTYTNSFSFGSVEIFPAHCNSGHFPTGLRRNNFQSLCNNYMDRQLDLLSLVTQTQPIDFLLRFFTPTRGRSLVLERRLSVAPRPANEHFTVTQSFPLGSGVYRSFVALRKHLGEICLPGRRGFDMGATHVQWSDVK